MIVVIPHLAFPVGNVVLSIATKIITESDNLVLATIPVCIIANLSIFWTFIETPMYYRSRGMISRMIDQLELISSRNKAKVTRSQIVDSLTFLTHPELLKDKKNKIRQKAMGFKQEVVAVATIFGDLFSKEYLKDTLLLSFLSCLFNLYAVSMSNLAGGFGVSNLSLS